MNQKFCINCGSPTVNGRCPRCNPVAAPAKVQASPAPSNKADKSSKKKTGILVAVIILLVLAVTAAVLFATGVFGGDDESKPSGHHSSTKSGVGLKDDGYELEHKDVEDDFKTDTVNAEDYYRQNGDLLSVTKADGGKNCYSEKEIIDELNARGFDTKGKVIAEYSDKGKYIGEIADANSSEIHPTYQLNYTSGSGIGWTIIVIEKQIKAFPYSYMLDASSQKREIIFAEEDYMMCYDGPTNSFYKVEPFETTAVLVTLDEISVETLDGMTKWEISNYDN